MNSKLEMFFPYFIFLCIFSLVATPIVRSIAVDGRADFCYVTSVYQSANGLDQRQEQYKELWAHRPWRSDMRVGLYKSDDEVIAVAAKYGCPLYTK